MAPHRLTPPILVTCLCGALANDRSATGRWFCAEHLPRRDAPPAPPRREPVSTRPELARTGPAQRDLFRS
ncbi:hypothetical protein [Methylobacterium frigidaeris]|uniref:Uncharacterized protein n=1 Tax=Methylobacterium frigidaeris TaxID=2038277 RepID=A0AA37M8S3_9HYPH|nr:hypothetical protein [Methylobacterium frigidaeris]PIK73297.1 hypothetical protein CS379_09195 [Methylobacterium frigidaeris]GJD66431.1 hypothetical protein MPEAHAMD_6629 [Methylobacterium frigidaeris]